MPEEYALILNERKETFSYSRDAFDYSTYGVESYKHNT